jgi:hypothetical protein
MSWSSTRSPEPDPGRSDEIPEVEVAEAMAMDAGRKRWFAALGLFLVWVATLATMAVFSGHRPTRRPEASVPR